MDNSNVKNFPTRTSELSGCIVAVQHLKAQLRRAQDEVDELRELQDRAEGVRSVRLDLSRFCFLLAQLQQGTAPVPGSEACLYRMFVQDLLGAERLFGILSSRRQSYEDYWRMSASAVRLQKQTETKLWIGPAALRTGWLTCRKPCMHSPKCRHMLLAARLGLAAE